MICPACQAEAVPGARFCPECGAALPVATPRQDETRLVTVLFADMSGSVATTHELDPEAALERVSEALDVMSSAVARHGGRIDRFLGDGSSRSSERRARARTIRSGGSGQRSRCGTKPAPGGSRSRRGSTPAMRTWAGSDRTSTASSRRWARWSTWRRGSRDGASPARCWWGRARGGSLGVHSISSPARPASRGWPSPWWPGPRSARDRVRRSRAAWKACARR